ncbi:MAG: hypothetical protein ACTHJX_12495 [Terriglobales bacterium]
MAAGLALLVALPLRAQDPASSADRPPGNVNELTLAGLQPGRSRLEAAEARWGRQWTHPDADESDVYVWCDARSRLRIGLDTGASGTVRVVTVERMAAGKGSPEACHAQLSAAVARTGRGVRLGDSEAQLLRTYGKPFFSGPSSLDGHNVRLVVFNFSWAGSDKPQILESTFDGAGKLIKMTLSAEYY